jgi:hypothetical protein
MECRDAQFYLRLRRTAGQGIDELGADVTAALDGHMATCAECARLGRAAANFDRAIGLAMRGVPVPSGLRERLVTQAAKAQGAALRRTALRYGGLVAAAFVLIAVGVGIFTQRPAADADGIVRANDAGVQNPREYTQKWLAAEKLPENLPWDFDYDLWVGCGYEKIADRYVPVVTFVARNGRDRAKVYLFREGGEFDTKEMRDAQASHFTGQVVAGKEQWRGVRYLIVHTGPPNLGLQPFLRTADPQA